MKLGYEFDVSQQYVN